MIETQNSINRNISLHLYNFQPLLKMILFTYTQHLHNAFETKIEFHKI